MRVSCLLAKKNDFFLDPCISINQMCITKSIPFELKEMAEAVLTSTHNLCFEQKFEKKN